MKEAIQTKAAPAAIGPYSQAVRTESKGRMLYSSGQIPLNPETGELVSGTIEEETHQVMKNLSAVLAEAGLSFKNVLKCGIFCTDLADFAKINAVYETYLEQPYPARSTVQVAALPKNVRVEIDVIAQEF